MLPNIKFLKQLKNIPGWHTKRKLVIFTVDDYGSIRMSSKKAVQELTSAGFHFNHFNKYDTLECNTDLENLFEILCSVRDKNDHHVVFTPVTLVANPDFEKIQESGFQKYHFEPFTKTLERYTAHDKVYDLWKEGIKKEIFLPELHGREHLNIPLWMNDLQRGNPLTHLAFKYHITGIGPRDHSQLNNHYQAAFEWFHKNPQSSRTLILQSMQLFRHIFGYEPYYFTPPNGIFNKTLNETIAGEGIYLLDRPFFLKNPGIKGKGRYEIYFQGQKDKSGLHYIVRNAVFEPSSDLYPDPVDRCLRDIASAFKWYKPAIISSHRVNFAGYLNTKNRDHGLKELSKLLKSIIKLWPEVEFLPIRSLKPIMDKIN